MSRESPREWSANHPTAHCPVITPPLPDIRLTDLRDELAIEATHHLLPYWITQTIDEKNGGFVGRIDGGNRVVEDAPKAAVLNTRILWTFSAANRVLGHEHCRRQADRAYDYLQEHFWDRAHQGLFWMTSPDGSPIEPRKQVYGQAFGIYALSEYHRATGSSEALDTAIQLFELLETHGFDTENGGYHEAFSRDWVPLEVVRLSPRDPNEKRSMNTHLHLLEAYSNLYRVWDEERLAVRLRDLVLRFLDLIVDDATDHLTLFFNEDWKRSSSAISFGHDIEASWLLTEATDLLGDPGLHDRARDQAVRMADAVREEGVGDDHGLAFEAMDGEDMGGTVTDPDRHWWPQAEAIVGFLNAYQISEDDTFREAAICSWSFIKQHLADREHGEWKRRVSPNGHSYEEDDKVGPWKGPYHGVRACLEGVRRIGHLEGTDDQWPYHAEAELEGTT